MIPMSCALLHSRDELGRIKRVLLQVKLAIMLSQFIMTLYFSAACSLFDTN